MKLIPLTKGKFAFVDDEDYEFMMQWKWRISHGYAQRTEYIGYFNGKQSAKEIKMHRVINNTPDDLFTDHIDSNRLNNQKINLRNATSAQNQMNRFGNKESTSCFKGVSFDLSRKKWRAQIKIKDKRIFIGRFFLEKDAAIAYNEMAKYHFGEFAKLNTF